MSDRLAEIERGNYCEQCNTTYWMFWEGERVPMQLCPIHKTPLGRVSDAAAPAESR